jgi:hypothetical protein|tara:strand:- start:340 stop:2286 length:1947 start_codon:yes stop_codon:yes gene_type:complete
MLEQDKYSGLAGWLTSRLENWKNHRDQNYMNKWDEYYRIWRGIWVANDKMRDAENSRLISPATQQAVEATVSELEEATFGRDKWFDIRDDVLDENKDDIAFLRTVLQEDLERDGVKPAVCESFLNGAIYGTMIGKVIVDETSEKVVLEQPVEGTLTTERKVVDVPYIKVGLESISPKEFIIDPSALDITGGLGAATETIKSRYHVVKGIEDGVYRDVAIGGSSVDRADFGFNEENHANEDDKVKITEYWGLVPEYLLKPSEGNGEQFDYEKDDLIEAVVTIANDSVVLRAEENPYMMKDRPFVACQMDRVPNKFWGRGVCEKAYNPQKALDAELRSRIDALALTTHPMMAMDATRLPRGAKLEVKAGKTILTNGDPRSVIQPFNFGNLSAHTFTEGAELERMVQMATGAMDSATSSSSNPRNNTASGMSMLQAASIKRQKRTLMAFQTDFLIPFIKKAVWRKMQFDDQRYPVLDYKFVPHSTMGIMAKELEMTQAIQLMSMLPPESEAFMVLLMSVFDNSSLNNREQMVQMLQQMMQPNPQEQEMQQMIQQLSLAEKQGEVQLIGAQVQETLADAYKKQADAAAKVPNETDAQERILDLQKKAVELQEKAMKVANLESETVRNIPEMKHLESETILNLAKARQLGENR